MRKKHSAVLVISAFLFYIYGQSLASLVSSCNFERPFFFIDSNYLTYTYLSQPDYDLQALKQDASAEDTAQDGASHDDSLILFLKPRITNLWSRSLRKWPEGLTQTSWTTATSCSLSLGKASRSSSSPADNLRICTKLPEVSRPRQGLLLRTYLYLLTRQVSAMNASVNKCAPVMGPYGRVTSV
jgi:hypothetical protein